MTVLFLAFQSYMSFLYSSCFIELAGAFSAVLGRNDNSEYPYLSNCRGRAFNKMMFAIGF